MVRFLRWSGEALVIGVFAVLSASCLDELDCDEADAKAAALIAEFGSCVAGQRCELVPLSQALQGANELGVCIDAFQCYVALREGAGQEAFISRARDIVHRRSCLSCTTAKCALADALEAFCDGTQCRLRAR